jgi:tyrosyl-tRNA synthetase
MNTIKTDFTNQDMNFLLKRGVSEIISEEEMAKLLRSGRKLRLKEGFDPSSADIHLGHVVGLRKLRQFQELGHQVVLIVGDWTAQIGDPSGASITRPMLSAEKVKANAETYMRQFFKVVDRNKTEVKWQSEWFGKFTLADVIRLTCRFTVAQMLAREDFNNRFTANKPIAVTELLYPLLQAYDSIMVESDVEFGGQDQKFNLLVGRELQLAVGQKPQQCFMTHLLVGTDGTHKMSKSLGNYIGIDEAPDEIYGKVMSLADNMILQYFDLLTDVPDEELKDLQRQLTGTATNPMNLKKRLARELVKQFHGQEAATQADEHFTKVFQKREMPEELEEYQTKADEDIRDILVKANLVKSKSEANRLIQQGAVSIDGVKVENVPATFQNGSIIKVGKHRFIKIVIQRK